MIHGLLAVLTLLLLTVPAHAQPRRVAVFDFVNTTKDPAVEWLGPAAADDITTRLHAVRSLQLVERLQLYRVLNEQKLNLTDLVDPAEAVKVGKLLGVEQVVLGGFTVFAGAARFNARFVDVATGAIVATSQVSGTIDPRNPTAFWAMFDQLSQATIDSLNTRVAIVQGKPEPTPVPAQERIELTSNERTRFTIPAAGGLGAQEAYGRGLVAYRSYRWTDAMREFERATVLDSGYAAAWAALGEVLNDLGRWPEAMRTSERAQLIYERAGDERGRAATLTMVGRTRLRQGRFTEALGYYERSLRLREPLGDELGQAQTLGDMGFLFLRQGQYSQAMAYLMRSLRVAEKVRDEPTQVRVTAHIGQVHRLQGRNSEALIDFEQSLRLAEKLGDQPGRGRALYELGAVRLQEERPEEALRYLEESRRIAEGLNNEPAQVPILLGIGAAYGLQGRRGKELELLETSLRLAEKLGDEAAKASILNNIGSAQVELGRHAEALRSYEGALAIAERLQLAERELIRKNRDAARTHAR